MENPFDAPPRVGLGQKPEPIYLRTGQTMHLGIGSSDSMRFG